MVWNGISMGAGGAGLAEIWKRARTSPAEPSRSVTSATEIDTGTVLESVIGGVDRALGDRRQRAETTREWRMLGRLNEQIELMLLPLGGGAR